MKKITKDMTIGDVVDNYDNAQKVLEGYGMHCFSCPMSRMETIEEASAVHGLEVEEVLNALNTKPETKMPAKRTKITKKK